MTIEEANNTSVQKENNTKACNVIVQYSIPDALSSIFYSLPSLDCPEGYELNKTWGDAIKCSLATDCNGSVHIRGVSNNIEEMVFPQPSFLSGCTSSSKTIIRDSLKIFNEVNVIDASKHVVCTVANIPLSIYGFGGAALGSVALGSLAEMRYNSLAEKIIPALSLTSQEVSDQAIQKMSELSYTPVVLASPIGFVVGAVGTMLGAYLFSDYMDCSIELVGNHTDVSTEVLEA